MGKGGPKKGEVSHYESHEEKKGNPHFNLRGKKKGVFHPQTRRKAKGESSRIVKEKKAPFTLQGKGGRIEDPIIQFGGPTSQAVDIVREKAKASGKPTPRFLLREEPSSKGSIGAHRKKMREKKERAILVSSRGDRRANRKKGGGSCPVQFGEKKGRERDQRGSAP